MFRFPHCNSISFNNIDVPKFLQLLFAHYKPMCIEYMTRVVPLFYRFLSYVHCKKAVGNTLPIKRVTQANADKPQVPTTFKIVLNNQYSWFPERQ